MVNQNRPPRFIAPLLVAGWVQEYMNRSSQNRSFRAGVSYLRSHREEFDAKDTPMHERIASREHDLSYNVGRVVEEVGHFPLDFPVAVIKAIGTVAAFYDKDKLS